MDTDNNNNNDKANHCVYISFDNNDPSISSFINYLEATINRHGIYQLDDQSDRFAEQIRLLVVVFSKEYTFYALEKLVNHLQKKDLLLVVVHHGVTISSVEKQIAMLDQVTMWPRVLLDAAVLPAHVYNVKQSEYEFIEEIARDVCERLYPTEEIEIHRRQEEIEKLLCEQPWGVRTLGISGKPDICKTTLTIAVFRHMSGGYDASRIIKDFHTKYNEESLELLNPEFFGETQMEKFDLNNVESEPSQRKKRVLVALDDVRDARDAKSFLGGFNKFGPGSLIIITSPNEQILEECQMSEIYELKGLVDEEPLKLFTRCAFENNVTEENILELPTKEIECYDGNPCAIRSYAKEFKSNTMVEMGSGLPEVCEVLITGHDVSFGIAENKDMRYEEYDEEQENKKLPLDHNVVSATKDTKTISLTQSDLSSEPEFRSSSKKNLRSDLYERLSKSLDSLPHIGLTDWIIIP